MRKSFLIFLFLTFWSISAAAAFHNSRTYNAVDGLSSNTIFYIYQDSKGYLWFATSDGLNRFDSREFKVFKHVYDDDRSISNNGIRYLYEDSDNVFWIGTEDGMSVYDPIREDFTAFPFMIDHNLISNVFIFSIAEDNCRNLWITTLNHGVFRYDKNISVLYQYKHDTADPSSISSDYVSKVYVDAEGDVWFAAAGEYLCRYDNESDSFERIKIRDEKTGCVEANVYSMCGDSFGRIWLAGWGNGVFMFDKRNRIFTNFLNTDATRLTGNRIHVIEEVSPGKLMLGYDEGVNYFNPYADAESGAIWESSEPIPQLNDQFVYAILRDKEGGLWIGTYFGGVNYSPPNSTVFNIYSRDMLPGKVVSKFCEDHTGKVWFGTDDGGLFFFTPTTGKITPVAINPYRSNQNVHALVLDGSYLWVGTYSEGLYKIDLHTHKAVAHYLTFDGENTESVYSLYKDQAGQLWVGTKRGIYLHDYDKYSFTTVMSLGYNSDILDICEDNDGNVWFASINKGLLCYDQKTRVMHAYIPDGGNNSLHTNQLRCLALMKGKLWIGTSGNGLFYYDQGTRSFHKVGDLDNYCTIYHIIKDNGYLWLTTNEGLVHYNPETGYVNYYTQEDGLPTKLFNANSGIKASAGNIYLGSSEGFCFFNPQDIRENRIIPQLVFTDFRVFNRDTYIIENPEDINRERLWALSRGQHNFSIEFIVLSFCAPLQNKCRYILEGADSKWTTLEGAANRVAYTNVPPGRYTLKVMGCNNDETWSEAEELVIFIPKPFWKTNAMLAFYIIIFSFCIWFITYMISRRINRKHDQQMKELQLASEKDLADSKINFFTSVAHEIRTPVTLISAPIEEILKRKDIPFHLAEDLTVIKENSDRLIKLVNEILEFRQAEGLALQNRSVNISAITGRTIAGFRSSAEQRGIRIEFIDEMGNDNMVNIDPESYTKILSNLLTNALKHTRTKIIVRLVPEAVSQHFILSVADDGMGIMAADMKSIFTMFSGTSTASDYPMKSFGIGLSTVSLLVKKMDAHIEVDSEYGSGASFKVIFTKNSCGGTKAILSSEDELFKEDIFQMTSSKQSILIVEDNIDLLNFFMRLFSKNYRVHVATDGFAAFNVLKESQIDLVISDLMMPGIDGNELARRIRNDIRLSHIPIIMLTARTDVTDKIASLESGIDIYIEKPVSSTYLQAQVKSLLEKRDLMKRALESTPFVPLSSVSTNETDKQFMRRVAAIIEKNISNQYFSVENIAEDIHLSRSVLYTKLKAISDITPNDFIKLIRLRKAAEYLSQGKYRINEISYLVGFSSASYFSKSFHRQFGILPKDFIAQNQKPPADR